MSNDQILMPVQCGWYVVDRGSGYEMVYSSGVGDPEDPCVMRIYAAGVGRALVWRKARDWEWVAGPIDLPDLVLAAALR